MEERIKRLLKQIIEENPDAVVDLMPLSGARKLITCYNKNYQGKRLNNVQLGIKLGVTRQGVKHICKTC